MNIVIDIKDFSINNVFFMDIVKNTVMENSNFIRINYSNSLLILNGIYLTFDLKTYSLEKYFSKFKCSFNTHYNQFVIDQIINIEDNLLKTLNPSKKPVYKIKEQLSTGNIKLFSNNNSILDNKFLLKISGFWETDLEYGITYKLIGLYNSVKY